MGSPFLTVMANMYMEHCEEIDEETTQLKPEIMAGTLRCLVHNRASQENCTNIAGPYEFRKTIDRVHNGSRK